MGLSPAPANRAVVYQPCGMIQHSDRAHLGRICDLVYGVEFGRIFWKCRI